MHSTIQYSSTVQYVYSIQYSTVQNSPVMYSTVFSNSEQSAMRCRKVALVSFVFLFHQHSLSTATAMILSGVTNVPLSIAATCIYSTSQYSRTTVLHSRLSAKTKATLKCRSLAHVQYRNYGVSNGSADFPMGSTGVPGSQPAPADRRLHSGGT